MTTTGEYLAKAEAAASRGELAEAEKFLRTFNAESNGGTAESWLMFARILESLNRLTEAIPAFERAEELTEYRGTKARILHKMGDLLFTQPGSTDDDALRAAECLERSVELEPEHYGNIKRRNLCAIYFRVEQREKLIPHAEVLLGETKFAHKARLYLASAYLRLDEKRNGLKHLSIIGSDYHRLQHDELEWYLQLLIEYACLDEAQQIIARAEFLGLNPTVTLTAQAQVYYLKQDYDAVLEILTSDTCRLAKTEIEATRQYFMRAKSLEHVARYREAHQCFTSMNNIYRRRYAVSDETDYVQKYADTGIEDLPDYVTPDDLPYTPVFMVAFPRSGTTLLDTILATQSQIETLSEVDGITAARQRMKSLGIPYPQCLKALSEEEVDLIRDSYFEHNETYLNGGGKGKIVIDKLPLNILHLPFISVLFPKPKIIFSLRHPVDVCLSCFQQNFMITPAMFPFTDLKSTFLRYRDVMNQFERHSEALELDLHTVRYEELVQDLDLVAHHVFDFLGVKADTSYREYYLANQEKLIATPSREQVSRPIYQSSRNRWENYAEELAPFIPIVRPLADRFGY